MSERKRARAKWFNVYERPDGSRTKSLEFQTRVRAVYQARLAVMFNQRRLLYRIRVRRYLDQSVT